MNKKLIGIISTVILLLSLSLTTVSASEELANKTIKVVAHIPVFQEMEVIKPLYLEDVNREFMDKNLKEPVIIKNAGTVRVRSNTHWKLMLKNITSLEDYVIKVKVNGGSEWKNVSNGATHITGENGNHLLNFDLKFIAREKENIMPKKASINFDYTLVQI